ncbi:MAG: DUF4350 domain-containing protein [Acidothermus sp.]|nr:DUF4350 domain-containing protein [Acidothermus sp.]
MNGRRLVVLAAGIALIATLVVAAWATIVASRSYPPLDPRSYQPDGAHALAVLLARHGTTVERATNPRSVRADADTTVLITNPERVDAETLQQLGRNGGGVVLIRPSRTTLTAFGIDLHAAESAPLENGTFTPECDLPAARTAGEIQLTKRATTYVPSEDLPADYCYPTPDGYLLVEVDADSAHLTVLGIPDVLSNATLADQGNAALALGLLTSHRKLVWLVPPPSPGSAPLPSSPLQALVSLMPERLGWATLQLVIAVLVVAAWRGRRFGRLVPSRLPVSVPPAETVVGHGRLYHRARVREAAAEALRAATRRRIVRLLGLGTAEPTQVEVLADAVASRAGADPARVRQLLTGDPPASDHDLVMLGRELASLERTVRDPTYLPPSASAGPYPRRARDDHPPIPEEVRSDR